MPSAKSLPSSPMMYNRFNDAHKYDTIITNRNIHSKDNSKFSPFYYVPSDTYMSHNKTAQQPKIVKKVIYNTADDLNKYTSFERVIEIRPERSPVNTLRSRIYSPQDIYNANRITSPIRPAQRIIDKNTGTIYRNTENIFCIPNETSPNLYYKNHKSLMDSMNRNNIYVYDDPKGIYSEQQQQQQQPLSPTTMINSKLQPNHLSVSRHTVKSQQRMDDEEIIYIPMKRSDFLRNAAPTVSLSENKVTNFEQNEYLVLKEKTTKKSGLLMTEQQNHVTQQKQQENLSLDNFLEKEKHAVKMRNQANGQSTLSVQINNNNNKNLVTNDKNILNKNNMNFDPLIYKRYQITPTENKSIDNNRQLAQIENSSKVINNNAFEMKNNSNAKLKNPITGLFDFSKKKLISKVY